MQNKTLTDKTTVRLHFAARALEIPTLRYKSHFTTTGCRRPSYGALDQNLRVRTRVVHMVLLRFVLHGQYFYEVERAAIRQGK